MNKKNYNFNKFSDHIFPYLLLLPILACLLFIVIYPLFKGLQVSFQNVWMIRPDFNYVGFENYRNLMQDGEFWLSLKKSLMWTFFNFLPSFGIGMILALLLNKEFFGRAVVRGLILLPWAVPPVVAALSWKWMFNEFYGIINYWLVSLNIINESILWLADKNCAMFTLIMLGIWKSIPFSTITLLAGLQSIPKEIYEASEIDGAGKLSRFFRITFPMLRPIWTVTLLLMFIWTFNHFDLVYLLTRGGPGRATHTLPIYAYRLAFRGGELSYGAAVSIIMFIILAIASIYFVKRIYR